MRSLDLGNSVRSILAPTILAMAFVVSVSQVSSAQLAITG
jgi:hypothetical protein